MLDVDLGADSERRKHASQRKSRRQTPECSLKHESNTEPDLDEADLDEALFNDEDKDDSDATSDTDSSSDSGDEDESEDDLRDKIGAGEYTVTEDDEPIRKHKALCYEDIILWIVKDPKRGGRDVLAMEVHFRHHKGADNKPKPYVLATDVQPAAQGLLLTVRAVPSSYFAKTLFRSSVP
jgi:hypothetical protein